MLFRSSNRENTSYRARFGLYFWSYGFEFRENKKPLDSASWSFQITQIFKSDPRKLYFGHQQPWLFESENQTLYSDRGLLKFREIPKMGNCQNWFWKLYLLLIGVEKNPNPINSNELAQRFLLKDKQS